MSENGSDTVLDDTEPSMEDILASIRRIISEEEDLVVSDVEASQSEGVTQVGAGNSSQSNITNLNDELSSAGSNESYDSVDAMVEFEDVLLLDESYQVGDLEIPNANALAAQSDNLVKTAAIDNPPIAQNLTVEPLNTNDVNDVDILKLSELFDDTPDEAATTSETPSVEAETPAATVEEPALTAPDANLVDSQDENLDLVIDTEMDEAPEAAASAEPEPVTASLTQVEEITVSVEGEGQDQVLEVEIAEFEALELTPASSPAPSKRDDEIDAILRILDGKPLEYDSTAQIEDGMDDGELASAIEDPVALTDKPARRDTSISEDEDIDVVKSLMADLTGPDPQAPKSDATAANGLDHATSSTFSEIDTEVAQVSQAETEDDLLGEIVDMSIESEAQLKAAEARASQMPEASELDEDVELSADDADNALLAIAAAAEKDAEAATCQTETILSKKDNPAPEASANLDASDAEANETISLAESSAADEQLAEDSIGADQEDAMLESDIAAPESSEIVAQADEIQLEELTEPSISPDNSVIEEESKNMPKAAQQEDEISSTLIDEVTETATREAFASLTIAVEEKSILDESGPRIGDVVQDALRPMLKEWLDDNLQSIVERAVSKEVKRLSSGK